MSDDRIKRLAREQRTAYLSHKKAPDDRPLRPYPLHKPHRRRRMLGAGVVLALLIVVFGGITIADRIVDPVVPLEGAPDAPGPAWDRRVTLDDTDPAGDGRGMPNAAALWSGGDGTAVLASPAGVAAHDIAEGEEAWSFTPEGGHLCAAAEKAAGDDGGTGVVVVGREEAADEDEGGSGDGTIGPRIVCDTVVALDLESGEERWRFTPSDIGDAEDLGPGAVHIWADGARTVAAWGPFTVGIDAGSGEELWSAPELDLPEEACAFTPSAFSADGQGGAALLGECGSDSTRRLTTVLDTGTGETSRTRALPSASGVVGPHYTLVSADPVAVLSSPGLDLLPEDDEPQDELFTADGDDWRITRTAGESGFGPAKSEWSLDSDTTFATRDGVLYATPGGTGGWARVVALDLATGRTLWDRRLSVRDLHITGFSGDRLLAAAAIEGDEDEGEDAEVTTRLLDLPTDGEGPAQVLAADLPELPSPASSGGPWAVAVGGGYAVGTAPRDPDRDGSVFVVAAH
ncbi:hypothetical protein O4J56_26925 [Nocardiopsis sp. RSe5-2]|uniref:Pyrroloquinoline-quinone binding quinoprotein n=1 Tax=Nocardiopsis endophytica TaxID=3018445 RepID=A0ABT4UD78_9ACTN|nr:hypothetical protein [Nocardiopsis endophytica]MDA2814310.1 hypothetical protein [Nocardiopsis endophytica]